MHMETIWAILKDAPMEDGRIREVLAVEIYEAVLPYQQKGIHNEQDELDFSGEIEVLLDEGGVLTANARVQIMSKIYDAAGFARYWEA